MRVRLLVPRFRDLPADYLAERRMSGEARGDLLELGL